MGSDPSLLCNLRFLNKNEAVWPSHNKVSGLTKEILWEVSTQGRPMAEVLGWAAWALPARGAPDGTAVRLNSMCEPTLHLLGTWPSHRDGKQARPLRSLRSWPGIKAAQEEAQSRAITSPPKRRITKSRLPSTSIPFKALRALRFGRRWPREVHPAVDKSAMELSARLFRASLAREFAIRGQ